MEQMAQSPYIEQAIAEANALSAALAFVEGQGSREEAARLTEKALHGHVTEGLEGVVVRHAMERVVGRAHGALPTTGPQGKSLERRIFEATSLAWLRWTNGEDSQSSHEALQLLQEEGESCQPQGGALHLMALRPWQFAVRALLSGDREEARRLFRRATELGSQCGTESSPVVQWTYAATFCTG